jgi:hypothetical protein
MSTQPLRHVPQAVSAPKADTEARAPGAKTVAVRLAGLTATAMPWLSKDADLTPPDGGPEVIGLAAYPPSDASKR